MSEERAEWEVAWFPSDQPDQKRTYADEGKARDRFATADELGHFPILSRRVIVVSDWEIVANAGLRS